MGYLWASYLLGSRGLTAPSKKSKFGAISYIGCISNLVSTSSLQGLRRLTPIPRVSESGGLGWGPETGISNSSPGAAAAAGLGSSPRVALS